MARGLVKPPAMKAALQASLAGRSLTEILVDNGELSEDDLARTLAEHHRLDHVDLEVFTVDRAAAALIEPDVARRFGAVPIAMLPAGSLVVALYDPNGSTAVLEFAQLTGRVIQPAVSSRTQVAALIDSLRREQRSAMSVPAIPAQPAPAPDAHLRSVPAGDIVVPHSSGEPLPWQQPAAPPPQTGGVESQLQALRERAEAAERRRHEADEAARAADELARIADARAAAAEQRALAAEALVAAANDSLEGMSSAADASSETLTRLVHACEVLEQEAQKRAPEMDALRARIRELEGRLGEGDGMAATAPAPALAAPAAQAASPAPPVRASVPPPPASARAARISPPPTEAPEPQAASIAAPVRVDAPSSEPDPEPDPGPDAEAEADAIAEALAEAYLEPSVSPTIDIVGDPGVPYVRALAPMSSPEALKPPKPAKPAKGDATKARGLRRLIGAIRRSG